MLKIRNRADIVGIDIFLAADTESDVMIICQMISQSLRVVFLSKFIMSENELQTLFVFPVRSRSLNHRRIPILSRIDSRFHFG